MLVELLHHYQNLVNLMPNIAQYSPYILRISPLADGQGVLMKVHLQKYVHFIDGKNMLIYFVV